MGYCFACLFCCWYYKERYLTAFGYNMLKMLSALYPLAYWVQIQPGFRASSFFNRDCKCGLVRLALQYMHGNSCKERERRMARNEMRILFCWQFHPSNPLPPSPSNSKGRWTCLISLKQPFFRFNYFSLANVFYKLFCVMGWFGFEFWLCNGWLLCISLSGSGIVRFVKISTCTECC
jgi:hypothetical protein